MPKPPRPSTLLGKPIAITGASSGIGAATALACAAAGMPVALAARRLDRCQALADQITRAGGKAIAVPCDVANPDDTRRLVRATVDAFGSLYAIYANAGIGLEAAGLEASDDQWRRLFDVNFFGTLNAIRPAVDQFNAQTPTPGQPRGHILLCSSCIAKIAVPYYSVYAATKAAQWHLGRALTMELEPALIHVSTVYPVGTRTEFFDNVKTADGHNRTITHTPEHKRQSPDLVAAATVKALRKPRPEIWTSPLVRLGMAICMALPGIEHFKMRSMVAARQH